MKIQDILLFLFYAVLVFLVIALCLSYIMPNDVFTLMIYNMALTITSFLGLIFIFFTKK